MKSSNICGKSYTFPSNTYHLSNHQSVFESVNDDISIFSLRRLFSSCGHTTEQSIIDNCNDLRYLVAVVVELVVAGEGEESPESGTQREEDLSGRCYPNL
jgi:hypothetical protein